MRLIDADTLIEKIKGMRPFGDPRTESAVLANIAFCPTIDAQPVRHGRWVPEGHGLYSCSECQIIDSREPKHRYCPDCGCKMDEEEPATDTNVGTTRTNWDILRENKDHMAELMIVSEDGGGSCWQSMLTDEWFSDAEQAVAANLAWLDAPAED